MKKLLIAFLCFQLTLAMGACKKPPPSPPPPPKPPSEQPVDGGKLFLIWSRDFQPDSVSGYFLDPVFSGDYIVYATEGDDDVTMPEADVRIFHKLTGELHSAWQHNRGSLIDRKTIDDCIVGGNNQNTIFIANKRELYAFDVQTRQRLWKKIFTGSIYAYRRISTMGTSVLQNYGVDKSWYRVSAFDPLSGQERIITQLEIKDNYEFDISPPAWTINASGDTLLLFLSSGWNFYLGKGRMEAYCYNVTQKKMEWHQKDLTPEGCSSGSKFIPIIIDNNKVIFQGLFSIHCFDIGTGELVWQYDVSWRDAFTDTPFLYYKGKLLVRGDNGNSGILYCYDAQTGQLLWQNSAIKAYSCPWGRMDAYNDRLYFTAWRGSETGALYCVSIATGEVEWYELPNRGKIVFGVLIDQQTGYLYCSTAWSVMCVDLNKTPKE